MGSLKNLKDVIDEIQFVEMDIRSDELGSWMNGIDYLFHFGNPSCGTDYETDPVGATTNTIEGFLNVLETARKQRVKKVVYASSASVYGRYPMRENKMEPLSLYGESRKMMESIAYLYSRRGVSTVGLRFFSVYGPRSEGKGSYASVVNHFVLDVLGNKQPIIYGNGRQFRDYVYVSDAVEATLLAMERGRLGDVYDVGTGVGTSYNTVVKMINRLLGTDVKPKYTRKRPWNYVYGTKSLDTFATEKIIGFKASVGLEEGVRKLIEYYGGAE